MYCYKTIAGGNGSWKRIKTKNGINLKDESTTSTYILQSKLIKSTSEYLKQYDFKKLCGYNTQDELINSVTSKLMKMNREKLEKFDKYLSENGAKLTCEYLKIMKPKTK